MMLRVTNLGTFLVVQWLGFHLPMRRVTGSIPGWGTKIPGASAKKLKHKAEAIL